MQNRGKTRFWRLAVESPFVANSYIFSICIEPIPFGLHPAPAEPNWIDHRIRNGAIKIQKDSSAKCYLFPDNPDTLRQFRQLYSNEIEHLSY